MPSNSNIIKLIILCLAMSCYYYLSTSSYIVLKFNINCIFYTFVLGFKSLLKVCQDIFFIVKKRKEKRALVFS
jgi:cobalamin biosynthesis protein CobD/CbiB